MNKLLSAAQTTNKTHLQGVAFITLSLTAAVIAQFTLNQALHTSSFWQVDKWASNFSNNSSPLAGLLLYLCSAWFFIRSLHTLGHTQTRFDMLPREPRLTTPKFGFWVTCSGLALFTALYAATPSANSNGIILAVIWISNITLLVISITKELQLFPPSTEKIIQWLRTHWIELFGITFILTIAFIIRFWNLELYPYSFINDEAEMGNNGICLIQGNCSNLFTTDSWGSQPMLAFVPVGISISLFGRTAAAVRLASVMIGCLAVLAVYLFTRETFGKKEAWIAMALLATLPVHVHFSRLGVDNIVDSLSTTIILGFLFLGLKRGSTASFLAAGIIAGLCMYTYPGSRLAPILGLGTLGYFSLRKPGFLKLYLQNIGIFIFALIVTAAPIAGYFIGNPNIFFARMEGEGIFHKNFFDGMLQTGISPIRVLIEQFMRSFLVYFLTPAPVNFFNSPRPYLIPLASIFFILGLAYIIWNIKKDERYLVLLIWFFSEIVLGSTITGGPPTSQRMLMSMPALTIIIAIGVSKAVETIGQKQVYYRQLQTVILLFFVIWVGYKDIRFYHYEYRIGHYFEDPSNEISYESAAVISALHGSGRLYMIADPGVPYLSFASFDFFSPDVKKSYLNEISLNSLANIQTDKDALFITTPDKKNDLKKLAALLPGGQWTEFKRRNQPNTVLYYSYFIKKNNLQTVAP